MRCKSTSRLTLCIGLLLALAAPATADFDVRTHAEGEALLAEQPTNPGVYMAYAHYLAARGNNEKAIAVLEDGRETAERSAELLVALGDLYRDQKQWTHAETAANTALGLDPDLADAHVLLGEIHFAQGWHQSGLQSFRTAMALDPDATRPRVRLLGGMVDDGQVAAAEDQCLQYISEDPENAELWMALGRIFEHQGKRREAFATYGQVLTLDPNMARAYARQGKLFCEFGQFESAESTCRRALEVDEDCALAHAYLGIALSRLGHGEEAQEHAARAENAGLDMTAVWKKIGQ